MNMKRLNRVVVFLLLLLGFAAAMQSSLEAQTRPPREVLRQLAEQIKEKIATTRQILSEFPNERARQLLDQAMENFREAEAFYNREEYSQAKAKFDAAIRLLDQALGLALDNTLKRLSSRLNDLMRQAENEVIGKGNREAERVLQNAKSEQRRAEEAVQRGTYAHAIERYNLAISLAQKAIDLARVVDLGHDRFYALAERVKDAVETCDNAQARTIYDLALKNYRRAEEALSQGNRPMAEQMYNGAIRLLLRALDLCTSGSYTTDERILRNEVATVRELINSARGQMQTRDDPRSRALMQRTEEQLRRAESAIEQGQYTIARTQLGLVRNLMERVLRSGMSPAGTEAQRTESELDLLRDDLQRFQQQHPSIDSETRELLQYAEQAATRAQQDFAEGRHRAAIQQILIGQRLLSRAENNLQGTRQGISRNIAEAKINRLRELLREAEAALTDRNTPFSDRLLNDAKNLLIQANAKLAEQRYYLAGELADIGTEMLMTALRAAQAR